MGGEAETFTFTHFGFEQWILFVRIRRKKRFAATINIKLKIAILQNWM